MPLFSVIIPTFNRADRVTRAIRSVLDQTLTDFELWVIDDGSTDRTQAVLAPYEGRIHYLWKANGGVASARNAGICRASAEYVAFLDSDDLWRPSKLESTAGAAATHPEVGLFCSKADVVNDRGRKLWEFQGLRLCGSAYLPLLERDFIYTSTVVVKRSCFLEVGTFDMTLPGCEDWDMWIRIARQFPICRLDESLTVHEHQAADTLSSDYQKWMRSIDAVVEKSLASDGALQPGRRQRIRSFASYTKGTICLSSNDEVSAIRSFREAIRLDRRNWKARFYLAILSSTWIRKRLPQRLKTRMRLPEAFTA